jgi:hypothetical protein
MILTHSWDTGARSVSARGGIEDRFGHLLGFAVGHAGHRLDEHSPSLNSLPLAPIMPWPRSPTTGGARAVRLADIFISYTSSDRDWAFWIAAELKELGHTPHIHEREVTGGADIYAWMEAHHDAADHVLCVVSDDCLKAPYSTLERNTALWQAASKRPGFVLLVVVKPCRLPTLSDHMRRCNLVGVPEEGGRFASARWRSARSCSAPTIPIPRRSSSTSPSWFRRRANSPRRGRSSSALWRFTRRRSAPTIP